MARIEFDLTLGIIILAIIVFTVGVKVFGLALGRKVDKSVTKTVNEIKSEDNKGGNN